MKIRRMGCSPPQCSGPRMRRRKMTSSLCNCRLKNMRISYAADRTLYVAKLIKWSSTRLQNAIAVYFFPFLPLSYLNVEITYKPRAEPPDCENPKYFYKCDGTLLDDAFEAYRGNDFRVRSALISFPRSKKSVTDFRSLESLRLILEYQNILKRIDCYTDCPPPYGKGLDIK